MRRLALLSAALLLLAAGCGSFAQPGPGSVAFALIGDAPYSAFEADEVDRLIDEMNAQDLAFVIHVGDITSGHGPCSDEWFEARKRQFGRSKHPFVIVPGDNDWVDCHRSGRDPLERLDFFRGLFESGDESLGERRIRLERQSSDPRFAKYREHMRWIAGDVLFVGVNVQGSNNNVGRNPAMDREAERRMAAVFEWLDEAVKVVEQRKLRGLVVFAQADPDFAKSVRRRPGVPDGWESFRNVLRTHALYLKKPVLFVHGDKHHFVYDQPLEDKNGKTITNFTRVEVWGSPFVRWIKAWIDPKAPEVFGVTPATSVPAN
jgi:predicted phosphodiesterase